MTTDRIEIDPRVMMGKPVIRGTRIPIELLLRKISEGASEDDLLDAFPRLQREDIRAAVAYAADTLAHEETIASTVSADFWQQAAALRAATRGRPQTDSAELIRRDRDRGH